MTRPPRIEYPEAFYHVMSRGNAGEKIFLIDRDREKFLEYLKNASDRFSLTIHTYCLMNTHYHLLAATPHANISKAMQWLNVSYAVYFNKKHQRYGHLFQGRFKAILLDEEDYFQALSRYIHLNPVRGHLVNTPGDYQWSSYNALIGRGKAPGWLETDYLLTCFHKNREKAQQLFVQFCEAVEAGSVENPSKNLVQGFILGNEDFVKFIQGKMLSSATDDREIPQLRKLRSRPTLEGIIGTVAKEFKCETDHIIGTGKKGNRAREAAIYLAQLHTGLSGKELGKFFGCISGARISMVRKKVSAEIKTQKELARKIINIEERIVNN